MVLRPVILVIDRIGSDFLVIPILKENPVNNSLGYYCVLVFLDDHEVKFGCCTNIDIIGYCVRLVFETDLFIAFFLKYKAWSLKTYIIFAPIVFCEIIFINFRIRNNRVNMFVCWSHNIIIRTIT